MQSDKEICMADSTLRKYIWLINTILDARKITFKEISDKWDISTLNYKGTELPNAPFIITDRLFSRSWALTYNALQ